MSALNYLLTYRLGIQDNSGVFVVKPLTIGHNPDITPINPYEHIYCSFSDARDNQLPLFAHAQGFEHPFGPVDRIKLIFSIIEVDAKIKMDYNDAIAGEMEEFY